VVRGEGGRVFECVKFVLHARLSRREKRWRERKNSRHAHTECFCGPPAHSPGVKMFLLNFKLTDVYFTRTLHTHYTRVHAWNTTHAVVILPSSASIQIRRVLIIFSVRFFLDVEIITAWKSIVARESVFDGQFNYLFDLSFNHYAEKTAKVSNRSTSYTAQCPSQILCWLFTIVFFAEFP